MTKLQAMGGVGTEYPKNSMTAFIAAQEQKYDNVFLEVERTADGMWRAKEDASPIRLRPKFVDAGAAVWEEVLKLAKTSGMKVRIGSS